MTVLRNITIAFNGFIHHAIKEYPNEVCGFLFADKIYTEDEMWHISIVTNVDENPLMGWQPDKKEMKKAKDAARKQCRVKIGNVHTHPFPSIRKTEPNLLHASLPSDVDLKYARKFNDLVRGIFVVSEDALLTFRFHDMFGNKIPIHLDGEGGL